MTPVLDKAGSIRRMSAFAIALAALLYWARSGASSLTVQVYLTIFIGVSTIWMRGQYAESLGGRQWVIPRRLGESLLALAIVLAVAGYALRWRTLGILAVLLVYFVVASAVAQVRQSESVHLFRLPNGKRYVELRPMRWGVGLTAAGVALAFGGAALLGPGRQIVLGPLLIAFAVLVLTPVGLSISSEQVIRRLCEKERAAAWLWSLGGAGAAVFAAVTAIGVGMSHSKWLVGVFVVLGLLVVALVSTTHADVVAVLVVVALMGVTPLQAPKREQPHSSGGKKVLVAIGDSYMSGEGASIYYEGTDDGGGDQCRRSPTAWAAMAAQDKANFDGLEFLACSGALTTNVLRANPAPPAVAGMPAPSPQQGEAKTQLDAYYDAGGTFTPRMVVVSLGGNDAGFSTIGLMCVAPGNCDRRAKLWTDSLGQLRRQLRATYREVDAAFPDVPVVVVPYPDPISFQASGCSQVVLSGAEQQFIQEFLINGLNRVIRETAQEYRFHYLAGMQGALAENHLQLCDPLNDGRPGINFIGLRSVRGIAEQRFNPTNWMHSSLHPNERGHAAMLRVFQNWLATDKTADTPRVTVNAPVRDRTVDAPRQTTEEQAPQCDLFDSTEKGCRPQGKQWAYQQVGRTLLINGPCVLLAAAGAWCVAVALFALSRRRWARRSSPPDRRCRTLL